ncbi:MAG: hypothetical protein WKF77_11100 [Planctomycetaceae bacterium]
MRLVRLILVVGGMSFSCSAGACLNDSELPDHEREFRSQYLDSQLMTSIDESEPTQDGAWIMSATGVTLLAGAIGLTLFARR